MTHWDAAKTSAGRMSLIALAAAAIAIVGAEHCAAQTAPPISLSSVTRVEEDWEVAIGVPDPDVAVPQVVTVISPSTGIDQEHAILELNHSTLPEFYGGGLQLQSWYGQSIRGYRNGPSVQSIHQASDVITFTTAMEVRNGLLSFEVYDGFSNTWGTFGSGGSMKLSYATTRQNLAQYQPDVSVRHSRVGFGSGRVDRFQLKSVRYYSGTRLLYRDSSVRDVE